MPRWSCATRSPDARLRGCFTVASPSWFQRRRPRRSAPPASGSGRRSPPPARRGSRCRASAARVSARASALVSTPKSSVERRLPGARLRHRAGDRRPLAAGLQQRHPHDGGRGDQRGQRDDDDDAPVPCCRERASFRRHAPSVATNGVATFPKAMPNYRELLAAGQVRDRRGRRRRRRASCSTRPSAPLLVDVRELDEWTEGRIPGAIHIPRGNLESRIEQAAPDHAQPIVLYCAAGNRSAFAAKSLEELGYENVVSLAGGYTDWKRNGFPTELPRTLDGEKRAALQPAPPDPRGRRGGPAQAARLARPAARRGRARLAGGALPRGGRRRTARHRRRRPVDASNLQRQVLHSTARLGEWKAESAKRTLEELNPDVEVVPYIERLTSENVERILADGWDVIVDGADNFPTRYLINDAAVWHDIPLVHGSIYRFEGQATVFKPRRRPVLPLPLPAAAAAGARAELRRGRRARRPAGHRRLAPGERGAEALPRHRRAARRPAAALRRARDRVQRGEAAPRSRTARSAATARRSPSTSTTSSSAPEGRRTHEPDPHPTDAARRGRRRARGSRRGRHRARAARRPDGPLPGAPRRSSSRTTRSRRS